MDCTPMFSLEPQCEKTHLLICAPYEDLISLRIRAVLSESSLFAWRNFASLVIQNAADEYSDQTVRIYRLVWTFDARTHREQSS